MKKLLLVLIMVLLAATVCPAGPFLVCDPDTSGVTKEYVLVLNTEVEIITPAPLHYDLANLNPGEYVATVWGKNGLWRGPSSIPFAFEKPSLPLPTGTQLSEE